ncbi:MAG: ATP-binding protein [Clostridia bacterium]
MLYGTTHKRSKLSKRLTAAYAMLFSIVLLVLSCVVFMVANHFLMQKQRENILNISGLVANHIEEELNEGVSLDNGFLLSEQNTNWDLNMLLTDENGIMMSSMLNYNMDEAKLPDINDAPKLIYSRDGQLMMCYERSIFNDSMAMVGKLYLVMNMRTELSFLKLLGVLLIAANVLGAATAVIVGWTTTRRMLAPIDDMISAARSIGSKNLDERLNVPPLYDELSELASTINSMLDRVEHAYRQQSRFAANASHELRTPLAILQGNAELIMRWGSQNPTILAESMESIHKQISYMSRIVENLLLLARNDDCAMDMDKEEFHVAELMQDIVREQTVLDGEHTYSVSADTECAMYANISMIKQMLRALVDNSVKYTPKGGDITICCEQDEKHIRLTVMDTGIGMNKRELEHIFERFYRVDKVRSRDTGGMGLGLSIAQSIAQLHGGNISAASEPGKWTRVTAEFPYTV